MRATLHDELMRDAGFETDYHRERVRRDDRRNRLLRPARASLRFVGRRIGIEPESWPRPRRSRPPVEAVRPSLNDELMREAGFETDYERYLAWRSQQRSRALVTAAGLVVSSAGLIETLRHFVPGIPRFIIFAALAIPAAFGAIVLIAKGVLWLRHDAGDPSRYLRIAVPEKLAKSVTNAAPKSRRRRDEERARRERAELVASIEASGAAIAEPAADPAPARLSRRELLLVPLPAAIIGALIVSSGWWLLLGFVGVVCLAAYLFVDALDKELRSI